MLSDEDITQSQKPSFIAMVSILI